MKGRKRGTLLAAVLAVLILALAAPAEAKTVVNAKKYSLKTVTKATEQKGQWVTQKGKTYFKLANGKYLKSRWLKYGDKFYYLDSKGRRVSGWIQYRGKQYYTRKNTGVLYFGWLRLGKKTYYMKPTGEMTTGRSTINKEEYYFDKNGARKTGWVTIGKYRYYFDTSTGRMKKECWVKTGKNYRYVMAGGQMAKSRWLSLNGKKFYVDSDGVRVTGTQYIGNKGYYFDKNGVYNPNVKVSMEVNPNKKMVALTYDDGPGPYTTRLLSALQKSGAKATFFMVGSNVGSYKSAVKKMASMGCELGNHSWSHPALSSLSTASIHTQVSKTNQAVKNAAGKSPTLMRLPYGDGASNSRVLSAVGLPSIYWSIDTNDWRYTGNPQHTINEVLNKVRNGDIVLMHDIHKSSVIASETIIPALKSRGYQMVTVSQLAKYKGKKTLKAGKTYYSFR